MRRKNSLIWAVQEKGNSEISYLLGTMHVKDAKAFVRMEDMQNIINQCDVFATEFNLAEAEASVMAETMSLPRGVTLENMLGEKKYQKMKKMIQTSFGLEIDFFNQNLPIMLANIITEKVLSDDMQLSLDATLSEYAFSQGKTMIGIETFEEQMDILEQIPMEYQIKSLKDILKNVNKFRKKVLSTASLYETENIAQLYQSVKKSSGAIRHLMLYDRNVRMANRLSKIIPEQSLAFAVGAGHLSGKKGLIKLLKDEGFTVKPVIS